MLTLLPVFLVQSYLLKEKEINLFAVMCSLICSTKLNTNTSCLLFFKHILSFQVSLLILKTEEWHFTFLFNQPTGSFSITEVKAVEMQEHISIPKDVTWQYGNKTANQPLAFTCILGLFFVCFFVNTKNPSVFFLLFYIKYTIIHCLLVFSSQAGPKDGITRSVPTPYLLSSLL